MMGLESCAEPGRDTGIGRHPRSIGALQLWMQILLAGRTPVRAL